MSDPYADDPFRHLPPPFGDMVRMMQQQAGETTAQARAFAINVATEGKPESNVDPLTRMKVDQLARVAELRVADATGLELSGRIMPCTRSEWAASTLDHYQPLFDLLAMTIGASPPPHTDPSADHDDQDPMAWLAPMLAAMQPMMLSITTGSMVGHLAVRGFGSYELPVPRPPEADVLLIVGNAEKFARDWTLPADDLTLWLCLHQMLHHAVLSVPHVHDRLTTLLRAHVGSFQPGVANVDEMFASFDLSNPEALQQQMVSTDLMLGMTESDEQRRLRPQRHALLAAIDGFVDVTMDRMGEQLIGSYQMTTEALRRRRVEVDDAAGFAERLLGFDVSQAHFDRGAAFAAGVVAREGTDALARLWSSEAMLPTPAEIDAPGLWLARIEFED